MLLADFGTTYCKTFDTDKDTTPHVYSSRNLPAQFMADLATGHNASRRSRKTVNELSALARGGQRLIAVNSFVLLDCGSRDIKFIRFHNGTMADMGWNTECGASMGFTIELLASYYNLDYSGLAVPNQGFSVTCGVLGMSHIFDAVVRGNSEAEAVAKFVRGIALNAYRFAGEPRELYLSGGLCENPLFVACLPCTVHLLGRFVLLEGLKETQLQQSAPQNNR